MENYESPRIIELGSLAQLTLGESVGAELDADFPDGTPFADLTFTT